MKKFILGFSLIALFSLFSTEASAQLTFTNNTPCPVKVFGAATGSASPCMMGPYCQSPTVLVNPFSTVTLNVGACPTPVPPVNSFVRVGVYTSTGLFLGVSICGTNIQNYIDCTGTPRTLQQFGFNNAAIF